MQKVAALKRSILLVALFCVCGCQPKNAGPPFDVTKIQLFEAFDAFESPHNIPTDKLPGQKLVRNYPELKALGLFDKRLTLAPERLPWPSTFFPIWFGGMAGRWQDSKLVLLLRSLWGMTVVPAADAEALLKKSTQGDERIREKLYGFSALEKYDLAMGDYTFRSTRGEALARGHNLSGLVLDHPFWSGYCNGVALAAVAFEEPTREVDVLNPDGHTVRFHPNDIKGLLSMEAAGPRRKHWQVGRRCFDYNTSVRDCMEVNPAVFVLALTNLFGLAHETFIIDQNPLAPVINNAIQSAIITILNGPYAVQGHPGVHAVIDVRIDLDVASTLLSSSQADLRDTGEGVFKKAQGGSVKLQYFANIGLDTNGDLVGGRWIGPKMSGPDFAWGPVGDQEEEVSAGDHTYMNRHVRYSVIHALHEKSLSKEARRPVLDIAKIVNPAQDHMIAVYVDDKVMRIHHGKLAVISGRLGTRTARMIDHMNCFAGAAPGDGPGDFFVVNHSFAKADRTHQRIDFQIEADVAKPTADFLKCYFYGIGAGDTAERIGELTTEIFMM